MPKSVMYALLAVLIGLVIYLWWWRPHHIDNGRIPPVKTTSVSATPTHK